LQGMQLRKDNRCTAPIATYGLGLQSLAHGAREVYQSMMQGPKARQYTSPGRSPGFAKAYRVQRAEGPT